jgi:hypothetical protein
MISIVAADGVIRERLPDETLLVFLSDTHIGGLSGSDIFDSGAELTMLLEDLHLHGGGARGSHREGGSQARSARRQAATGQSCWPLADANPSRREPDLAERGHRVDTAVQAQGPDDRPVLIDWPAR